MALGVFSTQDSFWRLRRDAGLDAGVRTDLLAGGVELGIGSDISSSNRGGDMEVDDGRGKSRYLASEQLRSQSDKSYSDILGLEPDEGKCVEDALKRKVGNHRVSGMQATCY